MASGLVSSIQSLSTKLLHAIRGTTSTFPQQDPPSPVSDQHKSVREDLEKLNRMLARIQAVQQDVEEREIHDRSVRLWLEELRGVAYQAEDVLDEFHYEVLRSIVESGDAAIEAYHRDRGAKRKFAEMHTSSSIASYSFTITKASIPDGMAENIKSITETFEEISNARRDLHLREEDGTRLVIGPQRRPPTSSHVDERALFGREEEKEKIICLLNPSNGPDFMVLPIVGMGGFGKTTLAQLVYNDSRIHRLFNKRCWVSVHVDFDLVRLTKAIVDSVSDNPCKSYELSKLQDVLKNKTRGLKLFLVLDDVWNEKRNLWEYFRVGFIGAKFVRILTTTRNNSAAKIMQTTSPFQLGSLPEGNCWSLFKHFAFGNREASENANLRKIGRGIVKKCKGSPLAIKALGGILRYEMDEEKWREILRSNILEIDETREVMSALRLSYQKLPQHVKPCFLYLSMFPKGTPFEKDMVVRLWMAQGYINGNTRNLKTLEEIGSEYFDELQGRSLVNRGPFTKYFLHDLIHDLARSISQEAYQPFLENDQQYPHKVCHLYSNKQDNFFGSFLPPNNYRSIRTFVKVCSSNQNFDFAIFSKIACVRALQLRYSLLPNTLSTLKHLRYLSIKHSQMEMLPETFCLLYNLQVLVLNTFYLRELPKNIKNLINLRYLHLRSKNIKQLPESIFLLRNLHTLSLRYCTILQELPKGIEQLTRLRILDLPASLIYMPSGIGKLTTLKPLSGNFNVMDHGIIGGLGEIKDMNKLSGLLCITGLRNISDVEHSKNANLASKPNLHKLILNFQEDRSMLKCSDKLHLHLNVSSSKNAENENDEKIEDVVLQSLQPHGNLTELAILKYEGRIFPSWLLNPLLPKLTTLMLNFNTEPNFLPSFGQLPYLRFLTISGSFRVRNTGNELSTYSLLAQYGSSKQPKKHNYPSLEVLSLRNNLNLVEWQAHDGDFPCLRKLVIENCPKLWKIATIPQKVREVTFKYCSKLKLLKCPSVIRKLNIHKCGFREIMFASISEDISISNCLELKLIKWGDERLNSIREVGFQYCPKLELVTIPVGTSKLEIHECGFREIMFRSVCENLTISNCVELISVNWRDMSLYSTREVCFKYCPKLEHVTIPVGTLKLEIHECGFREIIFRSVSENLTISDCVDLISVNCRDMSLNSVREVSFKYCPKLEFLMEL
ncbi:putative disease resistance RPP13-like protein 1 [Carex rostrata]